jgi:hypothetical protein
MISFFTELSNKEVAHSGVEIEEKALGLVIKIINFPKVESVDPAIVFRLQVSH